MISNLSIIFIYQNIKIILLCYKSHEWKMGFPPPSQLLSCFCCEICGYCSHTPVESKGLVLCKCDSVLGELSSNVKLSKPPRDVLCCPEHSEISAWVQSGYRFPCTGEKKKCLFLKILVPCPHASISVQISIWGIDTQYMEPYSFFFFGEFSK